MSAVQPFSETADGKRDACDGRAANLERTGSYIVALLRRLTLIVMSVAAIAAGGAVSSAPASADTIPAPTLVSPANDPNTAIKDLVLEWDPVAGAAAYQVEVSRNQDFTNNTIALPNGGQTIATVFEMPMSLPHATYFWRVRAQVGGSWGPYSDAWEFLREWESLIRVVQTPSSTDPTLGWAPVPDASIYYAIFATSPVTTDDLFTTQNLGCFTNQTSWTPGVGGIEGVKSNSSLGCVDPVLVPGQSYYWGVAAFDDTTDAALTLPGVTSLTPSCGDSIPECDASVATGGPFVYQNPTNGSAVLSGLTTSWHSDTSTQNPCDTTTPCPVTPTYSWSPVTGATIYNVLVYLDRDATTLYREYVSQYPTFTPPDSYQDAQAGQPYYWRVEAATCGGPGIQCSPPAAASQSCPPSGSTSTDPAPTVSAVSVSPSGPSGPQSMQGGTTGTVTLTGTNLVAGACVIPSAGVVTTTPSVAGPTSISFSYWAPVPATSVTFKIENPDGLITGASPAITVASSETILTLSAISAFDKLSGPVNLESPADGATEHGRTFTFSWDDYITSGSSGTYDPENYDLQVSTSTSFDNPVLDVKTIDLTQYTPPTQVLNDGHYYWRVAGIDESGNLLTWSAPRAFTVNATGPLVAWASPDGTAISGPLRIAFNEAVSGVNSNTVKVVPDGYPTSAAVPGILKLGATSTQYTFRPFAPLATGGSYDIVVSKNLVDANGNHVVVFGGPLRVHRTATNHSPGWTYSQGWTRHRASGAFSGSYVSASAGRQASLVVSGSVAGLYACKGPGMGTLTVKVAGHTRTVSENQSFTSCGVLVWHQSIPSGEHRLTVTVASGHGDIDAVAVS